MSESLLSFLLVRQPEKQPLSDSTINSKLNFVGKHHVVFYRYHFVLSTVGHTGLTSCPQQM